MYQVTGTDVVFRLEDGAFIPPDPENIDRIAYDAWLAAGGVPQPAESIPPPLPETISDVEFAIGLWKRDLITFEEAEAFTGSGALPAIIQTLLAQMPLSERQMLTLKLKGLTSYPRQHPFTEALRIGFGWSPAQCDDFFRFCKGQ